MNMQELYTRNQQMSTQFACLCAFCNSTQKAQKANPPFGHLAQNPPALAILTGLFLSGFHIVLA
jgi:hypothetical protein